jgi:hypothetical protein
MMTTIRQWSDRLLGRGDAAITVPVMDGALKANRVLDEATVVATLPGIDDLASDGQTLWASAGPLLYRLDGDRLVPVRQFEADLSAIAARRGVLAVAVGGRSIVVMGVASGEITERATLDASTTPLVCVNALAFEDDARLVFSEGARDLGPADWCRDLMSLGRTGRVARWDFQRGESAELARGLHHAFGVLPRDGAVLVSESWRHRVVAAAGTAAALPFDLPAYPSRMAPATGGGFWLSCFACRTQLVEFVLREPAYRQRMLDEIDPRYWIAPALVSGQSFLEPLQGAGVKTMGVLKPWAPPRSYGLVLRVGGDGRVLRSLHSQVDGKHHGITGVVEHGGRLLLASKGSGKLLSVDLGSAQ